MNPSSEKERKAGEGFSVPVDKNLKEQGGDDVVAAIYHLLEDSIEDARSLREQRSPLAKKLIRAVYGTYFLFFVFVCLAIFCPFMAERIEAAPNLYTVLLVILAVIPMLILTQVTRAVFGKKSSLTDTAFSPLEAVLKLMHEMKGPN